MNHLDPLKHQFLVTPEQWDPIFVHFNKSFVCSKIITVPVYNWAKVCSPIRTVAPSRVHKLQPMCINSIIHLKPGNLHIHIQSQITGSQEFPHAYKDIGKLWYRHKQTDFQEVNIWITSWENKNCWTKNKSSLQVQIWLEMTIEFIKKKIKSFIVKLYFCTWSNEYFTNAKHKVIA